MATDGDYDITRELDLYFDFCQLEYGVGACPAVLGQDSNAKCYNTLATCPVPDSYDPMPKPLTFVRPEDGVEANKIPSLTQLTIQASRLAGFTGKESPLGERGKVTATFKDHAWDDSLVDKYHLERADFTAGQPAYEPIETGTFWPKFRARNQFYNGRDLIVRTGIGDDIRTRKYVIETMEGFNSSPKVIGKDPLKLADDDRAQCPIASGGQLASDLSETDTTLFLQPGGIGDEEYPTSGRASIGKEYVSFTRSGDQITLTERGLNGTVESHDANDTFQLAKVVDGVPPADIVYDLLTNFSPVPASAIPKAEWDDAMSIVPNVYTADIAKPTSVKDLIGELAEQAGFGIAWDDLEQKILMVPVQPPDESVGTITDDMIVADSVRVKDAQNKRISRVWTAFGQIDPVVDLDEDANYRQVAIDVESSAEDVERYAQLKIRKIFSRWIPQFGLSVAQDLNSRLLARFQDTPRDIKFNVSRNDIDQIKLGETRFMRTEQIQNRFGQPEDIIIRILGIEEKEDILAVDAEEQLYIAPPDAATEERTIVIGSDTNNFNLRDAHDNLFQPAQAGDTVRCIVSPGVFVCSDTSVTPAFDTGRFANGVNLVLEVSEGAVVSGRGGSALDMNIDITAGFNFDVGFVSDWTVTTSENASGNGGPAGGVAIRASDGLIIKNNGLIQSGGGASSGFAGYGVARGPFSSDLVFAALVQGGSGGEPFGSGGHINYSKNTFTNPNDPDPYESEKIIEGSNATESEPGLGNSESVNRKVQRGIFIAEARISNTVQDGGEPGGDGRFIIFGESFADTTNNNYGRDAKSFSYARGSAGFAINGLRNVTYAVKGTIIGEERF